MSSDELAFKPPPGFHRAIFEDDLSERHNSTTFKHVQEGIQNQRKSLFLFKLPDGLDPNDLEGLTIPFDPTKPKSKASSTPIAKFTAGSPRIPYEVYDLAGSSSKATADEKTASLPGNEMKGFSIFLPNSASGRGKMSLAPASSGSIRYFSIAHPAPSASQAEAAEGGSLVSQSEGASGAMSAGTDASKEAQALLRSAQAQRKQKRTQPWEKLHGFFSPAGSGVTANQVDEHWRETMKIAKKATPFTSDEIRHEVRTKPRLAPKKPSNVPATNSSAAEKAATDVDSIDPSAPPSTAEDEAKAAAEEAEPMPTEQEQESSAVKSKKRKASREDETPEERKARKAEKKRRKEAQA